MLVPISLNLQTAEKFSGANNIHFDNGHENYLLLPVIP